MTRTSSFERSVTVGGSTFPALDFTMAVARRHAMLHAELTRRGMVIGAHDMIIAATALHHGLVLLTENAGEFSRVPGLSVIPLAS